MEIPFSAGAGCLKEFALEQNHTISALLAESDEKKRVSAQTTPFIPRLKCHILHRFLRVCTQKTLVEYTRSFQDSRATSHKKANQTKTNKQNTGVLRVQAERPPEMKFSIQTPREVFLPLGDTCTSLPRARVSYSSGCQREDVLGDNSICLVFEVHQAAKKLVNESVDKRISAALVQEC